jgi:hypothetical protein
MSSDIVSSIIPVATGGLLALLGVAMTPVISHVLTAKSEKRKQRIAKFEELFSLINAHDHWIDGEVNRYAHGENSERTPAPIYRASAIVSIYFPELRQTISELDVETTRYSLWMAGAAKKRLEGKVTQVNDGLIDAFSVYRKQYLTTVRKLSDYAVEKGPNL